MVPAFEWFCNFRPLSSLNGDVEDIAPLVDHVILANYLEELKLAKLSTHSNDVALTI